jgi:hypothetical protein
MNENKNKKTQEITERKTEQTKKSRLLVQLMQMASSLSDGFLFTPTLRTQKAAVHGSLYVYV